MLRSSAGGGSSCLVGMSEMDSEASYDSSGRFTIDAARQRGLLRDYGLEEPAEAVLVGVQGVVETGAEAMALRLATGRVQLELKNPLFDPGALPEALQRALAFWEGGEAARWQQNGPFWKICIPRQVEPAQVRREKSLLKQRCAFCPIPLKLEGHVLQPGTWSAPLPRKAKRLHPEYHLAEWYWSRGEQPGIGLFRPDASDPGPAVNSETTFWRECDKGVEALNWMVPWRVAGQVARQKPVSGYRAGACVVLRAETSGRSEALGVHRGVEVFQQKLPWPELPGLFLLFDASALPVDLSGLTLVDSLKLQGFLSEARQRISQWTLERKRKWRVETRWSGANAWQTRKEVGAWLSIWGLSMLTGAGAFLPLPFLALPWIVWHHGSRRKTVEAWNRRLDELGKFVRQDGPE